MIEVRDLKRIEEALDAGAESVLVPANLLEDLLRQEGYDVATAGTGAEALDLLEDLLETARQQAEQDETRYAIGDQVGVDPRHSGVALSYGVVTQIWPGQEPVYEVLLRYAVGTRMLYRESELLPQEAGDGR